MTTGMAHTSNFRPTLHNTATTTAPNPSSKKTTHPILPLITLYHPISPYITPYYRIGPHITQYHPISPHSTSYSDRPPGSNGCAYAHSNKSIFKWWIHCSTNYMFGCLYVKLAMDSMEHRINWWWLGISMIFCDLFRHFFKNNVVEIVNKMSTLHILICVPVCIQVFSLWILL